DSHRLEGSWRQLLRRQARPEAVPVACDRRKPGDALVPNEIIDLGTLPVCAAVIAPAESGVTGTRPRLGQARRQVVRIGPEIERPLGVAPHLPGGAGVAQLLEEPGLLGAAEDRLHRLVP